MWLGDSKVNPNNDFAVINLDDYRNKNPNRKIRRGNKKKHMAINYLPIKHEKTLKDFPTNKEFGLENYAVIRTRLNGGDEVFLGDINELQRLDEQGNLVDYYSNADKMILIMSRLLTEWTFHDENGGVAEISPENIKGLIAEDFEYLLSEVTPIMDSIGNRAKNTETEITPNTQITESEKNEFLDGSENEKSPSENEQKDAEG